MTDESEELKPPSPQRVAKRALILSAVVCRAFLEIERGTKEFLLEVIDWLKRQNLWEEAEPTERKMLQMPLGTLTSQETVNGTWRAEGLVVLAWALQRSDLPPHDQLSQPRAVADSLGFLSDTSPEVLAAPTLRSSTELSKFSEVMFSLHWRLRNFAHIESKKMDFAKFAKEAWFGPLTIDGLPLINGDLAICGKEIGRALSEDLQKCQSITMDRHQAANWLIGMDETYSEVDTST